MVTGVTNVVPATALVYPNLMGRVKIMYNKLF